MRFPTLLTTLVLSLLLLACGSEQNEYASSSFTVVETPAGPGSGQPALFSEVGGDESGRVWMSWIEPVGEGGHRLVYSYVQDGEWSEAREAARGEDWFVNWADLPGVMPAGDGKLAAWYLVRNSENYFGYDILMRSSQDGKTWSEPFFAHEDRSPVQHGFVSAQPFEGGFMAAWLDGRKGAPGHHHEGETESAMTLRAAKLDLSGEIREKMLIDDFVCSCCPTSMVSVPDGLVLAYRDRTPSEIRDISIARFTSGGWEEPYLLNEDGWEIRACPVNGPSLASAGESVAAAWYTGADDTHTVKAAFSADSGRSFSSPVILDQGDPTGRAGTVMLSEERALVIWQGSKNGSQVIKYAVLETPGRILHKATAVELGRPGPPMTPRLAQIGNTTWLAWTETNPENGDRYVRAAYFGH